MGKPLVDRLGRRYGKLEVIGQARSQNGNARWCCRCDCGFYTIALGNDLERGKVVSCGCHGKSIRRLHGRAGTVEYRTWTSMKQRCFNPSNPSYPHWGGRGITVCEDWLDFNQFFMDMGPRPSKGHSLERIDNDGNYEPSNCRWVKIDVQANNKRRNRVIEFRGRTQTLAQWAKEFGIGWMTLRARLDSYGWSIEDALTTSVGCRGIKKDTQFLEFKGRRQTVAAWAREVGLTSKSLRNRLAKGWALERALTEPRRW